MYLFDLFPLPKPMNPGFHPVMIRGHGDEDGQKQAECQIAAVVPIEFVEGHDADEADEENGQPPARKGCADPGALSDQAICSPDRRFELGRAGACHDRRPYWERTGTSIQEAVASLSCPGLEKCAAYIQ